MAALPAGRAFGDAARRLTAAVIAAVVLASAAHAQDHGRSIAEGGNVGGAPACASCHGQKGEGQPESGFPRLSGLNLDYLVHQLNSFAKNDRKNEIMGPIATALTPDERASVAAYYAGSPVVAAEAKPSAEKASAGEQLARVGDWAHGVPPCTSCHGPAGAGVGAAFPTLEGQNAAYITNQLKAWQTGERANDPMNLMAAVAKRLSEGQIDAVAAYFGSLDPARSGGTP